MKSEEYAVMLKELSGMKNVSKNFMQIVQHPPILQGDAIPEYWCRVGDDGSYYLFLAQGPSTNLKYPIYSGQSLMLKSDYRKLTFNINGKSNTITFEFLPYQSLMLKISPQGTIEKMDISFVPKDPVVKPKEEQKMNF